MKKKQDIIKVVGLILGLLIIDQLVKIYIVIAKPSQEIIPGVLSVAYVENTGGAFGFGSNSIITIIVSNFIVLGIVIKFLVSQFDRIDKLTKTMLCMVLAGGISNLLDRLVRGFVVDYIDIRSLFSFPVFNIADIYLVLGWLMLVFLTIKYALKSQKNKNILQEGSRLK